MISIGRSRRASQPASQPASRQSCVWRRARARTLLKGGSWRQRRRRRQRRRNPNNKPGGNRLSLTVAGRAERGRQRRDIPGACSVEWKKERGLRKIGVYKVSSDWMGRKEEREELKMAIAPSLLFSLSGASSFQRDRGNPFTIGDILQGFV